MITTYTPRAPTLRQRLFDLLGTAPMTSRDAAKALDISYDQARQVIADLIRDGIIEPANKVMVYGLKMGSQRPKDRRGRRNRITTS